MAKFRARVCPECGYYLGLSITRPRFRARELAVAGACLKCDYTVPIRTVLLGKRRTAAPSRMPPEATGGRTQSAAGDDARTVAAGLSQRLPDAPPDYARCLRAIGQDIENRGVKSFNLQCWEDFYSVWAGDDAVASKNPLAAAFKKSRLRGRRKEKGDASHPYRYSPSDIARIERDGTRRRRRNDGMPDGHSRSQLLRTLGGVVGKRHCRLLGLSWRDHSVGVVVETTDGRREVDVFRPDLLYDLWVKMYLDRGNRALPEFPRR